MKKYLDASDKINSIRLELRHPSTKNTKWVLVEGEDDIKIYGKLLNNKLVSVEQVHGGVGQLRIAVSTLVNETKQVLGIRDADFLHLNHQNEIIESLFVTDFHDTEMLMISSNASMNSLFSEFLSGELDFDEIRTKILNSISFLGAIRWYNDTHNLELNFKGISLQNLFNSRDLSLDKNAKVLEINHRSPNKKSTITVTNIEEFIPAEIDLYNVCNGHDFEKALASFISERSNNGISDKEVGKSLRLSYNISQFETTNLYNSLVNWEKRSSLILFES